MMLSISTLRAVDYYTDAASESFGYYEEHSDNTNDPEGRWHGSLAKRWFGNNSLVSKEGFASIFFGFDPNTGKPLTRTSDQLGYEVWKAEKQLSNESLNSDQRKSARSELTKLRKQIASRTGQSGFRQHRAGVDLTFSAPKDFSILVAAASPEERAKLLAAWQSAVKETLDTAEQKYIKTRLRDENGLQTESVAGAAIAMFEHIAARPVEGNPPDPDVHLHCVLFSPVLCHDEKTRALFSNDLRLNLKVLDAEARARLAQQLSTMGYSLVEDRQKNCTSFHLPGVSAEIRQRYSKRRGEILTSLASGEFKNSSVAAVGTRSEKGDWPRAEALAAWANDLLRVGISFEKLRGAKSDSLPHSRTNQEIINDLLSRQSYFAERDVRQALWEEAQFLQLPHEANVGDWVEKRANELLKSDDLLHVKLPDGSQASRLRSASGDLEPVYTTASLIIRENSLDEAVNTLGESSSHRIDWKRAAKFVCQQEFSKTLEAKAHAAQSGKSLDANFQWAYRPDQLAAIAKILDGPDVGFIQAFAGTGKTTAAHAILDVYRQHGYKVIALAPSNKAAGQLSDDCKLTGNNKAKTVDAFLATLALPEIPQKSIIFVDEASMLSFDHAEKLVEIARARGSKIVFQGDKEQLPSVERGRFFANCVEKKLGTDAAELTVITRQSDAWAKIATEASARGDFAKTLRLLEEHGAIYAEGTDSAVLEKIAADHLNDTQPVNQKLIVASRNADVAKLNQKIREHLVGHNQVEAGYPCIVGKDEKRAITVGAGDRIVFTDTLKKQRRKIASNGALGSVESVLKTETGALRIRVKVDGEVLPIEFSSDEFSGFQHGYAISIHKSQGATVNSCRYLFSEFVSSELAYVAMSRHRDHFGLYCRTDQRMSLSKWMSRRIEKLDARDLISVEALNGATQHREQFITRLGHEARTFLVKRFPLLVNRLMRKIVKPMRRQSISAAPAKTGEAFKNHVERQQSLLAKLQRKTTLVAATAPAAPSDQMDCLKLKLATARAAAMTPTGKEAKRPTMN